MVLINSGGSVRQVSLEKKTFWKNLNTKREKIKSLCTMPVERQKGNPLSRANIHFLSAMWDSGLRWRAAKGLSTANQLFDSSETKSSTQLQNRFTLLPLLPRALGWFLIIKAIENGNMYLIIVIQKHLPNKNHIFCLYRLLGADMRENTLHVREKREPELNAIIEDRTWEDICMSCYKGISHHLWGEFD